MHVEPELIEGIRSLIDYNKVYLNSTPIIKIGAVPILMHEIALAGLLPPLNMVFIGRSGPGKSQLIADITSGLFNGDAVHLRGSPDLRLRPVYCSVDLKLFKQGRVDEAVKPRNSAEKMLHIMEEFNRAPPVIQNEWLAVADGVLDIDGYQLPIGKSGYRVAIGAANVGNGEFSGTFQTDNALKERLVLALDFDGSHKPTELDYFEIFENSSDPRVVGSKKADNSALLAKLSGEVKKDEKTGEIELTGIKKLAHEIDYFVRMVQIYLARGLDDIEIGGKTHSKEELPNLGSIVEKDPQASKDLLNYSTSPSVRAIKVFGALVPSLVAVAAAKGAENPLLDSCYGALELILPFSDSLPKKLVNENKGSRCAAGKQMVELIKKDMLQSELLEEGIRKAAAGKLETDDLKEFKKPRIRSFARFLEHMNARAVIQKTTVK